VEERRTSFAAGALGNWGTGGAQWGGSGRGASWSRSRPSKSEPAARPIEHESLTTHDSRLTPDENQDAPRYIKGERIRHRRFGSGAILGLSGAGKDLKVSVAFDDPEIGTKQLLVAFAGLERDWESA
jgi:DNA helicase-2/ATP-dependent DNA helicase PcrA